MSDSVSMLKVELAEQEHFRLKSALTRILDRIGPFKGNAPKLTYIEIIADVEMIAINALENGK